MRTTFVALLAGGVLTAGCGGDDTVEVGPPPDIAPAAPSLPRLTAPQYTNSIHDLLGDSIVVPVALEPDASIEGFFTIGAAETTISARGVEQYEAAAYDVAEQAMDDAAIRDELVPCTTADSACAREVVTTFGRRAWRRPLVEEEITALVAIADDAAATLGDFHDGLEFAIAAILQAPDFLFRVELGEPDPERPGTLRYGGYEMASRLSFLLWNTTPDDALLDAAETGELLTDEGLLAQTDRLLEDPRARRGVREMFAQMYGLHDLDDVVKDPTVFTQTSPELGPWAREETLMVIEDLVFDEDADFRTLFTRDRTYVNRKLASLYMQPAPAREGFGEIVFPEDSPRRGLLGHASILMLYSHPVSSSATRRGKFIQQRLLCEVIPPVPTDVDTSLPEPSGTTRTLRERVEEHLTDPFCAGCHRPLDSVGLGLEQFDGLGRFRTLDNGAVIDPSGDVNEVAFRDARELGEVLSRDERLPECFVRNAYRFATGRIEEFEEEPLVEHLVAAFAANDYRVKPFLRQLVLSPGFRRATEGE